jgi:hypothetical protein
MPAGLADGFGSKEFAYASFDAIHPGTLGPPPRDFSRVRLYSVVLAAYSRGHCKSMGSDHKRILRTNYFSKVSASSLAPSTSSST